MINKVILIGNLGKDPEIRYMQDTNKLASFSLCTTETYKDKQSGEKKYINEWHRIVVFNNNLADFIEKYVKKGTKLFVEGALKSRKYTGTDGIEKNITEVVINQFKGDITILSSVDNNNFQEKKQSNNFENQKIKELENSLENLDLDDQIPF